MEGNDVDVMLSGSNNSVESEQFRHKSDWDLPHTVYLFLLSLTLSFFPNSFSFILLTHKKLVGWMHHCTYTLQPKSPNSIFSLFQLLILGTVLKVVTFFLFVLFCSTFQLEKSSYPTPTLLDF